MRKKEKASLPRCFSFCCDLKRGNVKPFDRRFRTCITIGNIRKLSTMSKKIEAFKIAFAMNFEVSDYNLIFEYDRIETCIEVICIRDLISTKSKFEFFKFTGSDRILIKANNRFLIEYCIIQNERKFELYELLLSKYNEFEQEFVNIPIQ